MSQKAGAYFSLVYSTGLSFLLFCILPGPEVSAQQRLFTNQQHFGVEEGLPQSFISNILQDDDGFIWISTLDGICRYDGRGFKIFRHNPKDSTSIGANVMNNMQRLRNNSVIIFYNSELADNFNMHSFKASRNKNIDLLKHIPHASWKIEGKDMTTTNRLFMMNNHKGMGWLDTRTGEVFFANKANGLLQQDSLIDIVESAEGKLYLVSENGVQVSDTGHKKFDWIPFATNVKKRIPLPAGANYGRSSIIWLSGNRLAIGYKDEIVLLDIDKKTSQVIQIVPSLKAGTDASTSELQADSKGRPYFVSGGRILRINAAGETELLWENTANPDLRISAFFIDRSDVLWLSVNAQGLLKIDLQASLFKSYGYETGFATDILKQAVGNQSVIPRLQSYTESSFSFRQTTDKKGNLFFTADWSGEDKIYHFKKGKLQWLPQPPIHHNYATLLTMPDSAIWAYDIPATAWYSWKTSSAVPEKLMLDRETMKTSEVTDALVLGGYIWMATAGNGLLQYQGTKRINRFAGNYANGVIPETLTEICADPVDKSKFWVGSRGGGLILWDVQQGLQRIYTTDQGLPNNTIYCILPDRSGKIWCSTNKGIFRFDITRGHVTAFEKTDGLPGNEFNRAHKFAFGDGRVAFGGLDGYTIFNPSDFDFKEEKEKVPVVLTGLLINNMPQDMSLANSLVKEPLSVVSFLELPYKKNYLRFEFAALLFNQPQKIKYRYQLKGADQGWIENGTNNIASYTALSPGDYTFRINATDNNGLWSDTIKEIRVLIHPPFWATWWAWLVYILAAMGLLRWYFIFREKQLKAKQNLAFEKREAFRLKEMDELKDRFFSNITHEFRTPLTLIITPLEKLEQDLSLSAAAINTVKTAQRNSKQLLRLINEFLDFSKLNEGQLKLNLSTGEPGLFTANCVQSFEAAAKEKNITLHFSASGCEGFYMFDENKWGKIISNLLSNALKFTPVNGTVSVSLFALADNINLAVRDNGPGIPADQQEKIFERFYQVENSSIRTYGGTGIGLSLVKELTDLMEGTIKLDSAPGGETCFLVRIPMKKVLTTTMEPETNARNTEALKPAKPDDDLPLLLIVEDNDELRSFLVETLQNHYRVIESGDGLNAWERILEELPDVVISDVMMPGRDGFDLCRTCKSDLRTAHIGFILLTSKAAHEARLQGLGTGADDYITKPFNLQELELRVTNLLQLQLKQRAWLQSQVISSSPKDQPPPITDPFLVQLYEEMDAKLDDAELGVEYLSKTMAMSRSTLNRKLKSLLDISANDLIRAYRLQKAAGLISSGLDISTVAYRVGFSSPSYFSHCFKEKYGITPSEQLLKGN